MIESLIGLAAVLGLTLLRLPIAFAMGLVGFIGFGLKVSWSASMIQVGHIASDAALDYGLSVVPLFILMGNLVSQAKLSDDLFTASNAFLGHMKGGLAMATVAACGGFAAVSGSSLATVATMAKVSIPSMRKFNYHDGLAAGTVAAGGTLGMLIPPSAAMIVYGILTETDISMLFVGGILPGIITVVIYITVISIVVRLFPNSGPRGPRSTWPDRIRVLGKVWGVVVLFLVIMGGIFFGVFTPGEAGSIGAVGALTFAVGRRKMTWAKFFESLVEAGRITALIFAVAFGALILNQFVNIARMPEIIAGFITELKLTPQTTIFVILGIFVLLGMIIEGLSMIFLTVPIFVPIVAALGYDLIWFGVVMIMVVEISLITPPIGLNVFVMKSMLPEVPLSTIFKGIAPFFIGDLIRLSIVVFVPSVILYLPSLM